MENINFKKKYGQNFIFDTNLLKAIVMDAEITKDDEVLEIGVGAATLTREICKESKKVVGYEIDKELEAVISNNLSSYSNKQIVFKDFMKEDDETIKNIFPNGYKVVANLPYYITTPIIFKILESETDPQSLTIMVQKEVAERICSKENTKDYGVLTVMINAIGNTQIKRIVKKNMFTPMPNVDSAICHITIDKTKYNILDKNIFKKVVNSAFNHRRKMLISNLKTDFNLEKEKLEEIFKKLDINEQVRGEVLSVEMFVNLSNEIAFLKGM